MYPFPDPEGAVRRRLRSPRAAGGATALAAVLALALWADPASAQTYLERMERAHAGDAPVAAPVALWAPAQEVSGEEVAYGTADGRELTGYLARPVGARDSLPALIVIHEWWGLNENIRAMARRLAGHGYSALAVDLYGDRVASTPDSAAALARSVDEETARENLRQAYRFLTSRGAPRVASIGWCFGGGWSLRTALAMPEALDAAVIYYGRLIHDPDRLSALAMPVQGHFGAEDGSIPVSSVRRFEAVLDSLGVRNEVYVYEGAGHAFANPSGTRYVPDAAEAAWKRTVRFLAEALEP